MAVDESPIADFANLDLGVLIANNGYLQYRITAS